MKQEKLLKYENSKLRQQLIFSMPAGKALCGRECKSCYAIKFQKLYPNVLPYRQRRYEASMQPDFASRIIAEIAACKKPVTAIRVHESSEFYSQQYIDSWHTIATALPHFTFYAFTKRLADFDFSALSALPNFILINSLQYGGLNYAPRAHLRNDIFICPATTGHSVTCGISCKYCQTKQAQRHAPQFVKH